MTHATQPDPLPGTPADAQPVWPPAAPPRQPQPGQPQPWQPQPGQPAHPPVGSRPGGGAKALGLLLAVPAVLACGWSYLLPTVQTVQSSFQHGSLLEDDTSWVGFDNYQRVWSGAPTGYLNALLLTLLPLACALLVAPAFALLAAASGRTARLISHGLLAAPLALFAPLLLIAARHADRDMPPASLAGLVGTTGLLYGGLVTAIAATAFLAALRPAAGRSGQARRNALLLVASVLTLAVLAYGLQAFTVPTALGRGLSNRAGLVPMAALFRDTFMVIDFGAGSAHATVLLAVLGVLGLTTTAVLLAGQVRITVESRTARAHRAVSPDAANSDAAGPVASGAATAAGGRWHGLAGVPWLLLTVVGAVLLAVSLWPLTGALAGESGGANGPSVPQTLLEGWLPPLLTALVAVGTAALAGFGIGALRPLGRWSELLLIPFAPWLYVGVGPLVIVGYERARDLGLIDSFVNLVPPGWVAMPALFAFTLLGRGQRARWERLPEPGRPGFGRCVVVPMLPLVGVAVLVSWIVSANDLLWPIVVSTPDRLSLAELAYAGRGYSGHLGPVVGLSALFAVLALALLVAAQLLYLSRLTIETGREGATGKA
jgi:hypothetical protein